ncbi:MAG: ABC transporter ATP-binding protein [Pseudomonadota bacterium]
MVEVDGLTVKFGQFVAVNNISFSVGKGEIFGFLGANGAGKTTTIRVLCGLLLPTAGKIKVAGINLNEIPEKIKENIGLMSQKFTLYDDLSIDENLDFIAGLRKLTPQFYARRKTEILQLISLTTPLHTWTKDLPGGIKQQVALAAAVLHDPAVIFLDEPTAGVTPIARRIFWQLIRNLAQMGKTVFVTTHYMDEAENCHRIALMRAGEIIALDTPEQLKQQTFPRGIFELTTRENGKVLPEQFTPYQNVASFQPYGLHYHAVVHDFSKWEDVKNELSEKFTVLPLRPSLEDVFIQLVEGQKR